MKIVKLFFLLVLLCVTTTLPAHTTDIYSFTSEVDNSRFNTLIHETRCVVCQNQSIADSNAPLANDLRNKIYKMILAKKSDDDIKNFLMHRYGDFILLKPNLNKLTILLWSFPFVGILIVCIFLLRFNASSES